MHSLPKGQIQQIKNGLVLQVALKEGRFWDEVGETRTRWDIEAPVQLPPEDPSILYPERLLQSMPETIMEIFKWETDIKGLWLWLAEVGLERYQLHVNWWPLLAALVLFQPPLDTLQEFAKYGGIERKDPLAKYHKSLQYNHTFRQMEEATSYDPMLVSPLIDSLPDPYFLVRAYQDYYETLIGEINERLKSQGLDIREMRDEILKDGTLDDSLQERLKQVPQDLFVKIPKHARIEELIEAVRLAASIPEEEPEKADEQVVQASHTDLMKVEIAYRRFCLRQDFKDMWERYPNISSSETFKKYASDGRKAFNRSG